MFPSTIFCPALLLIHYYSLLAEGTCYYPDQSIPSNYVQCDTASGVYSTCCGSGDLCTFNGYCFGDAGDMYRGACTGITWQSSNYAPECRHAAMDALCILYPCPLQSGSWTSNYCCSNFGTKDDVGCCNGDVFEPVFGAVKIAGSTLLMLASSSSSTAMSPSSVASQSSPSLSESAILPIPSPVERSSDAAQSSRKSLAVGTGVGIPVAVLLLFSLVYLFLRERRRRTRAQKMTNDAYAAAEESVREREMESTTARDNELRDYRLPQELEYVQYGPKEIFSQEVHEANGDF